MTDNMDLFEKEIEELREFSELDMDMFHDVLECTRGVVAGLGNAMVPVAVVDIIEGAVGYLTYKTEEDEKPLTVEEAVERAVNHLQLVDETAEIMTMLEDNKYTLSDEYDTGKLNEMKKA